MDKAILDFLNNPVDITNISLAKDHFDSLTSFEAYSLIDEILAMDISNKAIVILTELLYFTYDKSLNKLSFIIDLCQNPKRKLMLDEINDKLMKYDSTRLGMSPTLFRLECMDMAFDPSRHHKLKRILYDTLHNDNSEDVKLFKSLIVYFSNNKIYYRFILDAMCDLNFEHSYDNEIILLLKNAEGFEFANAFNRFNLPYELYEKLDLYDIIDIFNFFVDFAPLERRLRELFLQNSEKDNIDTLFNLADNENYDSDFYYPVDLLKNLCNTLPRCQAMYDYLDELNNHSFAPEVVVLKDLDSILAMNMDNFFKYFNIDYDIKLTDKRSNSPKLLYRFKLNSYDNKLNLIDLSYTYSSGSYKLDNTSKHEMPKLTGRGNKYIIWLIAYITNLVPSFKLKEQEVKNELEKENLKKENKSLFEAINRFNDRIGEEYNTKCGLDYYFEIENGLKLNFKIGNDKKYVCKGRDFIEMLDYGTTYSYGKGLTFKHDINNLNDEDIPVIRLLKSYPMRYDSKSIKLTSAILTELIFKLKGRRAYFDDEEYLIRLNKVSNKLILDDDYRLIDDGSISFRLDSAGYTFVFNKDKTIDYLDPHLAPLYKLSYELKGKSLKGIKDIFINDVLSVYSDDIIVSSLIKEDINTAIPTINGYYDINSDKAIECRLKVFKNDLEIDPNSSSDKLTVGIYNRVRSYLNSIGFNELGCITDDGKILDFLRLDLSYLKSISNVYLSEALMNKKIESFNTPIIKMVYDNDIMNCFMKESTYSDSELHQILNAIKRQKKFVLLKDDRIITLDDDSSKEFYETVEDLRLDSNNLSKTQARPLYEALLIGKHENYIEADEYLNNVINDIRSFKDKKFPLPSLNARLREYQIEALSWLKVLSNYSLSGILADDMGLGKTLEIISLLASCSKENPSLIVAPKSLLFNWISEVNRFSDELEIKLIFGNVREREAIINSIDYNKKLIYITSYDSIRNDLEKYSGKFNYLILDEAQYIKNSNALTTKAIKGLKARCRLALTGTPIENDIFDLWSIFDFLMPGYLPGIEKFKSNSSNEKFLDAIRRMVAPFILRRTKENVLKDLPSKFERVLAAEMTPEQRKLYDAHTLEAREILSRGGGSFDVLHLLTRLRQICVDPLTFVDGYTGGSGKINMLQELLREYIKNNHRILIFSQFVKALNIVKDSLTNRGIKHLMITGDTKSKDRIDYVNLFNQNEDIKVFLISLKAGGNGLNLVGADTVIHLDPWWNLASENQATDRAYRIGQTKNVEVIRLIVENSIEQRVCELQYKKKDLIDRLISNDTSNVTKATLDDIKFILE